MSPLCLDDVTLDSWVTADQHWEHPRIAGYQSRPDDHFELMRERWIDLVGDNDVVLHLGDVVCFGDQGSHQSWVDGLPGRKLLLRGNHDYHTHAWYEAAGFRALGRGNKPFLWRRLLHHGGPLVAFSHEPINQDRFVYGRDDLPGSWDVNVHGHVHRGVVWHPLPGKTYVNVSVEETDYAPIRLREALDRAGVDLA